MDHQNSKLAYQKNQAEPQMVPRHFRVQVTTLEDDIQIRNHKNLAHDSGISFFREIWGGLQAAQSPWLLKSVLSVHGIPVVL